MQQELFSLDIGGEGELNEWNWDSSEPSISSGGSGGDATAHQFQTHPSSQIGAYWPFIMFQGRDGYLAQLIFNTWNVAVMSTKGYTIPVLEGGAIQIVPVQQALTRMGTFYQQEDLSMVLYERDDNSSSQTRDGIYKIDREFASTSSHSVQNRIY